MHEVHAYYDYGHIILSVVDTVEEEAGIFSILSPCTYPGHISSHCYWTGVWQRSRKNMHIMSMDILPNKYLTGGGGKMLKVHAYYVHGHIIVLFLN